MENGKWKIENLMFHMKHSGKQRIDRGEGIAHLLPFGEDFVQNFCVGL
jgi:hypothetical protein